MNADEAARRDWDLQHRAMLAALDRWCGHRVRITIEGVAKLGQLDYAGAATCYRLAGRPLAPLSAITRIEVRKHVGNKPTYMRAWP